MLQELLNDIEILKITDRQEKMTCSMDFKTQQLLIAHGWSAARKIDSKKYAAAWGSEGYTVTPEAIRFIANLGGIKIMHEAYRARNEFDESIFDPIEAMATLDSRWVIENYEPLAQRVLCPIGLGFSKHLTYFLSERGEMYGGYDSYFCIIGRTIEGALSNIFYRHEFETLSE